MLQPTPHIISSPLHNWECNPTVLLLPTYLLELYVPSCAPCGVFCVLLVSFNATKFGKCFEFHKILVNTLQSIIILKKARKKGDSEH